MQFGILGPLEVVDQGNPLPLGAASQRELLALLLLEANQMVSADRLIDELWGGEPPGSGSAALQVRVSQLRKTLGSAAERIETRPPGYLLRVGVDELDLDRLSRLLEEAQDAEPQAAAVDLRRALALWRGPALADLTYAGFAQAAIRRLEELRLTAVERRIEADLAVGRHAELVSELEALVDQHRLREGLYVQLMLALYRSGRQAEALDAYQRARRTLVDELGIEPGPALQDLERAVLRQDPRLSLPRLPPSERSILVVPSGEGSLSSLLELAEPLALRPPKELILTTIVATATGLEAATNELEEKRLHLVSRGIPTRAAAFASGDPIGGIARIAVEQDVDLVLVAASPDSVRERTALDLLSGAPCDVAIVVGRQTRSGPVLVPFVGAEHDWTAVELAAWAAAALNVSIVLAGPADGADGRNASRLLANASLAIQRTLPVSAKPLLLEPGQAPLLAAAESAGLVVVGVSDRWRTEGLGAVRAALAEGATTQVVLVRRGLRPGGLAPPTGLTRFTWSLRV